MAIKIVRRKFIAGLVSAAVWPLAVRAQQPAKPPTIGFLGPLTPSVQSEWTAAFVQRMREHGWIDGRTIAIEYRWAQGRSERFAEIAAARMRVAFVDNYGDILTQSVSCAALETLPVGAVSANFI